MEWAQVIQYANIYRTKNQYFPQNYVGVNER